MKARDLLKGRKARKTFTVELPSSDPGGDPETFDVDLTVLDGEREAMVLQGAREYAKQRGGEGKEGEPLYELGHMVHTIALAIVDVDVKDKDEPFFESVDEVLRSHELGRDGIVYLYHAQKAFQQKVAPGRKIGETPAQYIELVMKTAEAETTDFFDALELASQQSYVLFTAKMLRDLLTLKSLTSSDSVWDGPTSKSENDKSEKASDPQAPSPTAGEPERA
jgi:hypothetical protein